MANFSRLINKQKKKMERKEKHFEFISLHTNYLNTNRKNNKLNNKITNL